MKEYYRQQAKLKSDQELQQKHPSNRSSVPSESILYRLHNAISNDEDGKNRPRLDDVTSSEQSTKLSILDHMPSLMKTARRVSNKVFRKNAFTKIRQRVPKKKKEVFTIFDVLFFSVPERDPDLHHLQSYPHLSRKNQKNEPALMNLNSISLPIQTNPSNHHNPTGPGPKQPALLHPS